MDLLFTGAGLLGSIVSIIYVIIKAIKKQPKKKAVIALIICFILIVFGALMPSNETGSNGSSDIIDEKTASSEDPETVKVEKKINEYINDNYSHTSLDEMKLNPDAGTEVPDDYVALVYLTWDQKNTGEMSKEVLTMYSEDMAARVYDDMPEIQEIAIFWTVPYLNDATAKLSFERKGDGMYYTDTVFHKNFN